MEIYKDKSRSISDRVEDLLSRMTLNQKIRQLSCVMVSGEPDAEIFEDGIGQVYFYSEDLNPEQLAAANRKMAEMVIQKNHLGIPAIFHCEALSGVLSAGHGVYPTSISLGASFMPELVENMGANIRKEMINVGFRQALAPVLDLARDFRWGRTGEDYGSDPTLVSEMACAYVRGLQGEDPKQGVIATAKHFLGYSVPEGGLNCSRIQTDYQDIRENFAKPFEAAIRKAGLKSVMNSYSEFEGEPICSSKYILTDLLRNDLGFEGTVVSDYTSIDKLVNTFRTAETAKEAGIQSLIAGMDVELPSPYGYSEELRQAVENGELDESYVDRSVRRVLTQKFEMGLFDEDQKEFEPVDHAESDMLALKMAEKLVTLLKNDSILPLPKEKKIAVIGPTADNLRVLNGGYTWASSHESMLLMLSSESGNMVGVNQLYESYVDKSTRIWSQEEIEAEVDRAIKEEHVKAETILEGLRSIYPHVEYTQGCTLLDEEESGFEEAIAMAKEADVVILTLGGKIGWDMNCSCGEGLDNTDIDLPGLQEKLMREILEVNSNVVIVHTDVKPMVCPFAYEHAKAIIEAWMPGNFGGTAIARAIAGEINPGGRLQVDIPRHVGQTPLYYYQHHQCRGNLELEEKLNQQYRTVATTAQLPFGYGLSYTKFEYSNMNMTVNEDHRIPEFTITATITNTGDKDGDEVVQLYGIDEYASVVRPHKILLGFQRVELQAGKSAKVTFRFRLDQMAFPNREQEWLVEKGTFIFKIGKNAEEFIQSFEYHQKETLVIDHREREFWAKKDVELCSGSNPN